MNAYDFMLPNTNRIIRTRLLLERLFSLGLGVSAYLLLAKLLVFLPDPEHIMFLANDSSSSDEAFQKRNDYDLFLVSNDAMEQGDTSRTDKERIRRRTARRTTNHNTNHLGNNTTISTCTSTSTSTTASSSSSNESLLLLPDNGTDDIHDFVATTQEQRKRSWRVALMLFVSLLIHNFPEGLCVVRTCMYRALCSVILIQSDVSNTWYSCPPNSCIFLNDNRRHPQRNLRNWESRLRLEFSYTMSRKALPSVVSEFWYHFPTKMEKEKVSSAFYY